MSPLCYANSIRFAQSHQPLCALGFCWSACSGKEVSNREDRGKQLSKQTDVYAFNLNRHSYTKQCSDFHLFFVGVVLGATRYRRRNVNQFWLQKCPRRDHFGGHFCSFFDPPKCVLNQQSHTNRCFYFLYFLMICLAKMQNKQISP